MARQLSLFPRRKKHPGGRPAKGPRPSERHEIRQSFRASQPVHVTIRAVDGLRSLRKRHMYQAIREALITSLLRERFHVVHLSIQRTHIHLLVEATDRMALARGMQGLQISAARHLNRAAGRKGTVFADRYHAEIIDNRRQARHALAYVLNNWRRHGEHREHVARTWRVDPFSSGAYFAGWRELAGRDVFWPVPRTYEPLPVWLPRTWLLAEGWRRYGLIATDEIPGPAPRPRACARPSVQPRRAPSRTAGHRECAACERSQRTFAEVRRMMRAR